MSKFKYFMSPMLLAVVLGSCNQTASTPVKLVLYENGMDYVESTKGLDKGSNALYYDVTAREGEKPEDVMPIGGFYALIPTGGSIDGHVFKNLLDEYYFQKLNEAGINMFVYVADRWISGAPNANLVKGMELAEKYNIGYFVESSQITADTGQHTIDVAEEDMWTNKPGAEEAMDSLIREISNNGKRKSFLGFHGSDEPFPKQLDNLQSVNDLFYKVCEEKGYRYDMFMNLLGYWKNTNSLWGYSEPITYSEYTERAFSMAKPRMLSVTQYPYVKKDTPEETVVSIMFDRLGIYRETCKKYNVPFWRMLQAGGQWNDASAWIPSVEPYQNEAELLFDVNIALAYGAKAIQYFPLVEPMHFSYKEGYTYDFERNGLIGADGNLTRWYYYAKRANTQVRAVDHVLMHANSEQIMVHGETANYYIIENGNPGKDVVKATSYKELKTITGDDCIVGCFDYKGGTALYVVNYSRTDKAHINMTFNNDKYLYEVIQRGQSVKVVGGEIPLTLDAGEAALVVLA